MDFNAFLNFFNKQHAYMLSSYAICTPVWFAILYIYFPEFQIADIFTQCMLSGAMSIGAVSISAFIDYIIQGESQTDISLVVVIGINILAAIEMAIIKLMLPGVSLKQAAWHCGCIFLGAIVGGLISKKIISHRAKNNSNNKTN